MKSKKEVNAELEDKKIVETNVPVNQEWELSPELDDETPLIAEYVVKKRSLYKVDGQFYLTVEDGHPIDSYDDGDLEDCTTHLLTKQEAVGLLRNIMIVDPNTINKVIGENAEHIKVPNKILKKVFNIVNN